MAMDDVKTGRRWRTPVGRFMGNRHGKVNQREASNTRRGGSNCHNAEPMTQACHGRS